jgi:hypothetical protein
VGGPPDHGGFAAAALVYVRAVTSLYVAAGGGGDALAAAMVHAARDGDGRPVIATYAWDRLLIDPLPGPRGRRAFTGLERVARGVYAVRAGSGAVPPAGSTLPRMAADLDADLILLDPYAGVLGLVDQLRAAAAHYRAQAVTLVDVGGDVVARGDEPQLKSPIPDLMALCACTVLAESAGIDADVVVAGPGLDGELSAQAVRSRVEQIGGGKERTLSPAHVAPIAQVLRWHPSEASGMLAAAASGTRGAVEVRDAGTRIVLDETSPEVYRAEAGLLAADNLTAEPLRSTGDFAAAEAVIRAVCGFSELDYEREKAARLTASAAQTETGDPAEQFDRVMRVEREATQRGSDLISLRRLAEAAGAPRGGAGYSAWRAALIAQRPHRYREPLWAVHD